MARMNLKAKRAKAAADALDAYIEAFADKHDEEERGYLVQTHNILTQVVANNGGPAWNAEDQTWEY